MPSDLIAIPDFSAGAMENWGLITYRENSLLFSESQTSVIAKQWIAVVVAHELAHQWFGNLVTMKWWDGLCEWWSSAGTALCRAGGVALSLLSLSLARSLARALSLALSSSLARSLARSR